MQTLTDYKNVTQEVLAYMAKKLAVCKDAGIKDFIPDPGLHHFGILEKPILVGVSRKSSIYKTLGITADEALNGSTVLHTIALQNGTNILRVHDVKEAMEAIKLIGYFG
jgi:dihydropteroate synthase